MTGLAISSLLDSEATALDLAIGIFYPILYVGGTYMCLFDCTIATKCVVLKDAFCYDVAVGFRNQIRLIDIWSLVANHLPFEYSVLEVMVQWR